MSQPVCPFCSVEAARVFHASRYILALWDGFPVSPGHALLVPKRHVASWSEATAEERRELFESVEIVRSVIQQTHQPDGFNVGWNDGAAAGQTVFHLHLHVIPRYSGDVSDPRGGVRHVIPTKVDYWTPETVAPVTSKAEFEQALIRGEDDPFLPHLIAQLDLARAADVAVAFVMHSGIELLLPHLEDLIQRGGRARILTGDYLDISDPDALQRLIDLEGEAEGGTLELRIFKTATTGSFHPKAYIFYDETGPATAYVGSSNISASALKNGLEWNYRVISARDRAGLSEVAQAFDELWSHPRTDVLDQSWLDDYRSRRRPSVSFVEIPLEAPAVPPEPHEIQLEAMRHLEQTREEGNTAGLVVLATGLGKTWLSAFDSNRPEFRRVLFVAHRDEILNQALNTYRRIRPQAHLGKYTGTERVPDADVLFASVQTLGRLSHLRNFERERFDYIVVDEFHHAAAATYRRLMEYFTPKFMLGLTATPERADGGDLLGLCQENLVFRCDLFDGIRRAFLSPFHYFGVPDDIDYSQIPWRSSRFDEEALTREFATQQRAANALEQWKKHTKGKSRTLGFCCSTRHADFITKFFRERGVRVAAVHSGPTSDQRASSLEQLQSGQLDIVFSVDMFNEGVDLPNVDTILMLRPTESRVLWLQQFGRGLRKAEGKDHLTIVDYIGNHKAFLVKPRALFGLGSDRQELVQLLDAYDRGTLQLPPGCEVTYELEAKNNLRSQIGSVPATPDALRIFYRDFRDREGRRPTAAEALHEGYNPRSVKAKHGSWLGFVADQGDLDPEEAEAREAAKGFLTSLEITPMTRSYKMLVLLSMLNRDALPGSITVDELTEEFARVAGRSARTRSDVSVPLDNHGELRTLIEDNPIRAWTGSDRPGSTPYFAYTEGEFRSVVEVPQDVRAMYQELVREIVDWRMAEYLRRDSGALTEESFDCKVSHSGPNPILFLPDRESHAGIPSGWTPVEFNGEWYQANFVKIALNVVQKEGSDTNVLTELLQGWFGPDAGRPGTDFHVLFEKLDDGWHARPKGTARKQQSLEIGRSYRRQDVATLLGVNYTGQTWQSGVVPVGNRMLLFVTLNKAGMEQQYEYKDKFISRNVFQWESQNQTNQQGKIGQRIRNHRVQGVEIHLFVRQKAKENGHTLPFVYCGQLEFMDWEGERPITVRWKLEQELTDSLAAQFLPSAQRSG